MREQTIFIEAVEREDPAERAAFLDRACAADPVLRDRIERLLRRHQQGGAILDRPSPQAAVTVEGPGWEGVGTVIGPYRLLERIGEGGMGEVWMAEQRQPIQRKVALKIIKAGMDTRQVVARFEAERQALALMDHPNIAKVFDAGATDSGRPYFVMELVKGTPITTYCDERRLTLRERLELFLPVCQAIQHAHQKGIIHRDIKPANVLIAPYDGRPVPKMIDFGVAKAIGQRLTERTLYTGFGAVVGTLEYMSPEQAELNNQDIDTRSDIYTLGVLLYELLTGTTPLSHERLTQAAFTEMLRLVREEEPSKPSTRLSDSKEALPAIAAQRHTEPAKLPKLVRGELDWIVMKALEKDRNRRYETANGLAHDIESYLHDEPVLACPPSPSYRVKKFLGRNKGPVAAVAVVLLALVGGVVGTTWGLVRAQQARRAESRRAEAERQAKYEAEARAAETQAVLGFVENKILAAARPEGEDGGLGREVTLRKAIEAALPFVQTEFTNRPLIEARLRHTLSWSFSLLGDARRAIEQDEVAWRLFKTYRGPDDPDTLRCMENLSARYLDVGRTAEALKLCEETLTRRKKRLGPDHPDTLLMMHGLAEIYGALGRHAEALKLCKETLALRKAALGPDHRDTLRSLHDLANSYEASGRLAEALKLHEEVLALQKAKFPPGHRDILRSMHEVACCYDALGRHADAQKLQEQALAIKRAKLGPDHPETIAGTWHLALMLFDRGQQADALKLHEEALALSKAKLGLDNPRTLGCMNTLAMNYLTAGRDGDARKLLDESLMRTAGKVVDPGLIQQLMYVRLRYFQKTKDAAGCRATAEMAEKLNPADGTFLYDFACWRAVTAAVIRATDQSETAAKAAAAEADRAMAWLKRAVSAGYSDIENMKNDKDLHALRGREDFQRLLADLEASNQKNEK
jgi:serine/threonine protein kinase/tetratricopeptide (TPR) repeat protein